MLWQFGQLARHSLLIALRCCTSTHSFNILCSSAVGNMATNVNNNINNRTGEVGGGGG